MPVRNRYAELEISMFFENVKDVEIQLTKDVIRDIQRLRASGVSYTNIAKTYLDRAEKGDGFEKSFLNDAAHELWKSVKAIAQNDVFESSDYKSYYRWEYNPGASHCEVCTELNGQIKTFEEWKSEGLPGHRNAGCYYNCCCDLVEVERPKDRSMQAKNEQVRFSKQDNSYEESNKSFQENNNSITNKSLPFDEKNIKLLRNEIKDVTFINPAKLSNDSGQELRKILENELKEFNGNIFNELKVMTIERFKGNEANALAYFDERTKSVGINARFYGTNVTKEDAEAIKKFPNNAFKVIVYHELTHYYIKKFNLFEDKEIGRFYKENEKYILGRFKFLSKYEDEDRPLEFFATATSHLRAGLLEEKNEDKTNNKLYDFIKDKLSSLK
jgi:hypothetical protein